MLLPLIVIVNHLISCYGGSFRQMKHQEVIQFKVYPDKPKERESFPLKINFISNFFSFHFLVEFFVVWELKTKSAVEENEEKKVDKVKV